jgi:hypothetical protein
MEPDQAIFRYIVTELAGSRKVRKSGVFRNRTQLNSRALEPVPRFLSMS